MSDILRIPIEKQQFPESAEEMLKIIEKVIRKWKSYFSPRTFFNRDLQASIDKHLFCLIEIKGDFTTKLSAVQELQLINMLCKFFEERKSSPSARSSNDGSPTPFELIFCGQENDAALHAARCGILSKTISLAAQLRCGTLLNEAAAWMQKVSTFDIIEGVGFGAFIISTMQGPKPNTPNIFTALVHCRSKRIRLYSSYRVKQLGGKLLSHVLIV